MYRIVNKKKLFVTILADLVGTILFGIPHLLRRNSKIKSEDIKKILIIRTAYVGDVVMTLPLLKPLKEKYPNASISFLTSSTAAPLLETHSCIDEVIEYNPFWFYDSSKEEYKQFISRFSKCDFDLVIESRGDIREFLFLVRPLKARYKVSYAVGGGYFFLTHIVPHISRNHRVEYHMDIAAYLGCDVSKVEWGLTCKDEEEKRVDTLLRESNIDGSFVAVHPGSRVPLKKLDTEKYADIYDQIIKEYSVPLIILGSSGEKESAEKIAESMKSKPVVMAGDLAIRELSVLIGRASLFVCNDSAPMHIASAMNTPTVAVFGPSKSSETGPYGNIHRVVEKDYPCRFACDESHCTHSEYWGCMKSITADDVFDAVSGMCREHSLLGR